MEIKFGPAGNSASFTGKSVQAPEWLHGLGLNAYEYQCGRGVMIKQDTAEELGQNAARYGIQLSLHAPYFTNLANPDSERRDKTVNYVLQSCAAASWMGATRVVVHSGSLMGRTRGEALAIACETLKIVVGECDKNGFSHIALCPELMGVRNQLGDLDEVMELCRVDDRLIPCIDFGHYNSRHGGILKTEQDYEVIIDRLENSLGHERAKSFHAHFSKIEYSATAGEVRHLTFADTVFGPCFEPLASVLFKRELTPTIICESASTQAEDAAYMMQTFKALK